MTMEHADLQRIIKDELERLKLLCFENGKLLEQPVEIYADAVYTFSRMGYNTLKHDLILARFRKALRNRETKDGYNMEI
jgi:hypothetical protein